MMNSLAYFNKIEIKFDMFFTCDKTSPHSWLDATKVQIKNVRKPHKQRIEEQTVSLILGSTNICKTSIFSAFK